MKYLFLYIQERRISCNCVIIVWAPICKYTDVVQDVHKQSESMLTTSAVNIHAFKYTATHTHRRTHTLLAVVFCACVAQRWDVEWSRKCVSHEGMCLCWLHSPITNQRENRHQHRSACSPSLSFSKPSTWSLLTSGSPRFLSSHLFPLHCFSFLLV